MIHSLLERHRFRDRPFETTAYASKGKKDIVDIIFRLPILSQV